MSKTDTFYWYLAVVRVPAENLLATYRELFHDIACYMAFSTLIVSGILGSGGAVAAAFFSSGFFAPFLGGSGYLVITLSTVAIDEPFW